MYFCPIGCREEPFGSSSELKDHLGNHLSGAPAGQIQAMVLLGENPAPDDATNECPLCKYTLTGFKRYIKHVGRHLEQLALFALPDLEEGLDDTDTDQDEDSLASQSHPTGQISSDAEDRPDSPSGHQAPRMPNLPPGTPATWHKQQIQFETVDLKILKVILNEICGGQDKYILQVCIRH